MTSGIDDVRDTLKGAEDIAPDPDAVVPEGGQDDPPPRTPDDDPVEMAGALFPLNDTGNGKRFCLYFGDDAMIVPPRWLVHMGR